MGALRIEPGKVIAKRYRVEHRVGTGAMGEVWAGQRLSDRRRVAVKVLAGIAADQREAVARFRREAQVLARVRSPYVAEVLDFFHDDHLGLVLVMDLIEGKTLHHVIWEEQTLSIEATNDIAADVLRGLEDLHAANIVHRDLKPGNIVLSPRGELRPRAVVIDFGVSRIISSQGEEEVTAITRAGRVLGTLEYMAPEQILGSRTVTPTADLYALGAIMFRAISGEHIHGDLKEGQLALAKLNEDPRPLPTGRDDEVAHQTAAFVARLLARRSAARFESAGEALSALAEFREPSVAERLLGGWEDDGDIDLAKTVVRTSPAVLAGDDDMAKTWLSLAPSPAARRAQPPKPEGHLDDEETVDRGPPPTDLPAKRPVSKAPPPLPPTSTPPVASHLETSSSRDVVPVSSQDVVLSSSLDPAVAPVPAVGTPSSSAVPLDAPRPPSTDDDAAARPRSRWRTMGSVVIFSAVGAFGGALFGVSYLQGGKAYEFVQSVRTAVGSGGLEPADQSSTAGDEPAMAAAEEQPVAEPADTTAGQRAAEPVGSDEPGPQEEAEPPADEQGAAVTAEAPPPPKPTPPPRRPAPPPPQPPPSPPPTTSSDPGPSNPWASSTTSPTATPTTSPTAPTGTSTRPSPTSTPTAPPSTATAQPAAPPSEGETTPDGI